MKRIRGVQTEPCFKSVYSWRTRIVALMSMAMLCGIGAFAEARDTNDVPELPSYEVRSPWSEHNLTMPIVVKVVQPSIPMRMIGTEVRMLFRIKKNGKLSSIRSQANVFDDNELNLAAMMKRVLREWEFTPPYNKEGQPVEVKVALPVKVVEPGKGNADYYANVTVIEPVLLAVLDR